MPFKRRKFLNSGRQKILWNMIEFNFGGIFIKLIIININDIIIYIIYLLLIYYILYIIYQYIALLVIAI